MTDSIAAVVERAQEAFRAGYHCSEALVIAIGDHYLGASPSWPTARELLIRASCPFGGGVAGCRDELCGVLSGGILIVGAMWGRVSGDEDDEALRAFIRRFRERFIAYAGGTQCRPIRDSLPEVDKRCLPVVAEGTRILMEMIEAETQGWPPPAIR